MKRLFYSLSLLTLALTTSCTFGEGTSNNTDNGVKFNAKINRATRATDLQFENGDAIGVYASYEGSSIIGDYAQNVIYNYQGSLFTTDGTLRYPSSGEDLQFYAIYPYNANSDTVPEFYFAVNTDQREHSNYTQSDLMTASALGEKNETVNLTFNHRLAKIVINITSENMPAGEPTLTFRNVKYIANANLNTNTYYASSSTANVIASANGTNSFKAILPPQSIAKDNLFAEIRIGNEIFEWVVNRDLIFNSGVEYTYNVELDAANNIAFTTQINPWGEPEEIESVIPEEYIAIIEQYMPVHKGNTPPNVEGVYFISPNLLLTDNVGFSPGHVFADDYVMFYDQSADNTISMKSTQLLGDLTIGTGQFISGSGENFTIYFNDYSEHDDGSWLTKASIISGSIRDGVLYDYTYAFIVLDEYDTVDAYMNAGQYRILYDGDNVSYTTEWPLDTRSVKPATGISKDAIR